jgi:hypothetical protein
MKILLIIIAIFTSCMGHAQNRLYFEEDFSVKPDQLINDLYFNNFSLWRSSFVAAGAVERDMVSGGLNSTIKFGININNYAKEVSVEDFLDMKVHDVLIGDKVFEIQTASKIYDESFPTVVGHFGFSGDVTEGNAKYFAINFHKDFPNYNLLLIQTMASANFSKKNCYYSLGGIDEAYTIISLVNKFTESYKNINKSIHFIGGSSSSAGIYHAASYINKNTDIHVKGLFLQSGFNNMNDILNVLDSVNLSRAERKNKQLRKVKIKEIFLTNVLLGKRLKAFHAEANCGEKFQLNDNKISYYSLVHQSFETLKVELEEIYELLYPGSNKSFENVADYYSSISLDKHIDEMNFNMFWLHSKDDPMSDSNRARSAQINLKKNKQFSGIILKNGGHSAFKEVYGENYINRLIENFLKFTDGFIQ